MSSWLPEIRDQLSQNSATLKVLAAHSRKFSPSFDAKTLKLESLYQDIEMKKRICEFTSKVAALRI